jgi:hypothetical protein
MARKLAAPASGARSAKAAANPPAKSAQAAEETSRRKRTDIVHTSIYVPKEAYRRLREIAVEQDCKVHDLVLEGLNAVLSKYGGPTIAKLAPKRAGS